MAICWAIWNRPFPCNPWHLRKGDKTLKQMIITLIILVLWDGILVFLFLLNMKWVSFKTIIQPTPKDLNRSDVHTNLTRVLGLSKPGANGASIYPVVVTLFWVHYFKIASFTFFLKGTHAPHDFCHHFSIGWTCSRAATRMPLDLFWYFVLQWHDDDVASWFMTTYFIRIHRLCYTRDKSLC